MNIMKEPQFSNHWTHGNNFFNYFGPCLDVMGNLYVKSTWSINDPEKSYSFHKQNQYYED